MNTSDTATKLTGAIKWFDSQKGFGFIVRDDGKPDLFCHIRQVAQENLPNQGDRVFFIEDKNRRPTLRAACCGAEGHWGDVVTEFVYRMEDGRPRSCSWMMMVSASSVTSL